MAIRSARQLRFRAELKKILKRGVPATKAMTQAWKRVPKNPRKSSKVHRRTRGRRPFGARRPNAPRAGVEIYDRITAIEGVKGSTSAYAGQHFRHRFTRRVKGVGLGDGSIRLVGGA